LQDKYDRNAYNKRYRERRKEKAEAKKEREDDKKTYEVGAIYRRASQQPARDALKAMKEDWQLGPLAPRRDVGENAGKLGTVPMGEHELHNITETQRKQVEERMGDNVFRVHDRVVVLSGRDRGKIGQILSVDEEKMSASIEGINKVS
jgi:large subunit ribosomal protein L24